MSACGERGRDSAQIIRRQGRNVTLQVDHDITPAIRVQAGKGGADAIGAGWQGRVGEDCASAGGLHGCDDFTIAGGDCGVVKPGRPGNLEHAHDHWLAGDVGKRLVRKAGRRETGGDEHEGRGGHQP
jgi:hypothetical protein